MKRIAVIAFVIAVAGAALYYGERSKAEAPVTPAPLTHIIGDAEREATRVPMSMTRLSDDREIEAGNRIADGYLTYLSRSSSPDDDAMAAYVEQVGRSLAVQAHRKLPYRFHYVPDMEFVNAFAVPGGHVFIGKGLIAMMTSEDQLADVLAHEVEHIDHYHCVERLQVEVRLRHIPLAGLAMVPIELFQAGYSKEQELEADREGIRLASKAGYSATAVSQLFRTMDERYHQEGVRSRTPQGEMSRVVFATLTEYFRSHPPAAERIAQIEHVAAEDRLPVHQEKPLQVVAQ
ncbi:MAG TPA: M48 family metallopeptidase [Terriglobales bacterium]|nr:M48 family metallopeptidase [Terriglobales bacterium]